MKYKFSFIFCNKPFLNCLAGYDPKDLIPCKCKHIFILHLFSGGPMIDYNRKLMEKFKQRDNRQSIRLFS